MELYQLNSFIAVAEALNLTRAAKMTHQSPSAVSSQIKSLEAHLNLLLFKRTPRGMILTAEGESLLIKAKKVLQASQNLEQTAMDLQKNLTGNLNIGINTDPVFLNISGISQTMARTMPGIKLSFIETQTFATAQMLLSRQIDLGFHFGGFNDPQIRSLPLSRVLIRVVLPANLAKEKEAPLERLVTLPWVWTRHCCPFHQAFKKQLDQLNLTLTPVADAVDENIVRELVKSGTGIALMREEEALALVEQDKAKFWQGPGMEIPLALACLENRKDEKSIAALTRAITTNRASRPGLT